MAYSKLTPPSTGEKITYDNGKLVVPQNPIVCFIEGDGIGPDIWSASKLVFDTAIEKAYKGERKIEWFEIFAGEKSKEVTGEWLPEDTFQAIRDYKVAIKGPLTTPVGKGFRSLNVTLRQVLDLYSCVRPVRYFQGVSAPVKAPEKLDVVIFRENTEDVYAGLEWLPGDAVTNQLCEVITTAGGKLPPNPAIGIKPISEMGSKRLIKAAIDYAIQHKKPSVTLVHKGNIMKFTEGAFRDFGYELAKDEYGDILVSESDLWDKFDGKMPAGKILIKDRIADAMFQQLLLRPDEYSVIATMNLNGDYLSDACAAQVGGLGLAPGANIGAEIALFEATHGTAPKYTGMDKVNPSSVILSGVMMLEHLGMQEAADLIVKGIESSISKGLVTYDLARQMENATEIKCSEFGKSICENME